MKQSRSILIAAILGLPQRGPRSGDSYCFFTSDLPAELKSSGAGMKVFEIFLVCAIFLDDKMIPVMTKDGEATVIKVLDTLVRYGKKWSMTWAIPKLKVL